MTLTPVATNGHGTAALTLGIAAVAFSLIPFAGLFLAPIPAVLAIVFGHIGVNKGARTGTRSNTAVIGCVMGYAAVFLMPLAWMGVYIIVGR